MNLRQISTIAILVLALAMTALAAEPPGVTAGTYKGSLTASGTTCDAATKCVTVPLNNMVNSVAWQITGTFSATITFEGTVDNTNWVTVAVVPVGTTRTLAGTATAAGVWQENVSGLAAVRARCSAFTSGTAVVTARRAAAVPPAQ